MDLFNPLVKQVKGSKAITVAVVNPTDEVSLGGVIDSFKSGIIEPILYGDKTEILETAKKYGFDISKLEIVNCADENATILHAIDDCSTGKTKILMKGKVHTGHLMGAVFNKSNGLRTDRQVSHLFAMSVPSYHKLLFITDAAINIAPTLEQKEKILMNSISFIKTLGVVKPKVACLSALEVPNPKILSSMDALALAENKTLSKEAIIEGPLAFDNAISLESSQIKGIKSELAGDVDLLLVPNIESGNILFKSLVYLSNAQVAGVVLGAKIPIVLTSRADNAYARFLSIILARLVK